jgi:hypothetical protein
LKQISQTLCKTIWTHAGKQTFGPPWILFKYFIICQIKRGLQIVIKGAKEKALKAKGFPKVETTWN